MNINTLKALNLDRVLELDEAVALAAYARTLTNEFGHQELDVPDWLETVTKVLNDEIARRTREADLAALRNLEHELEGYKTVSEKRTEAQRKLAGLQKRLGLATTRA